MKKLWLALALFGSSSMAMAGTGSVAFLEGFVNASVIGAARDEGISISHAQEQCFNKSQSKKTKEVLERAYLGLLSEGEIEALDGFYATKFGKDMLKAAAQGQDSLESLDPEQYATEEMLQMIIALPSMEKLSVGMSQSMPDEVGLIYLQKTLECDIDMQ